MRRFPAFFVSAILVCALLQASAFGQRKYGPSPLDTLDEEADQDRGREIMELFRSYGIADDFLWRFQLRIMPRRGESRYVSGMMLGSQGRLGPSYRIDLLDPVLSSETGNGSFTPFASTRLLLRNGENMQAYKASGPGLQIARLLSSSEYFEPVADSEFTVFDLLMPFIYWPEYYYEGRTEFRGRPTHVFWMYPPDSDASIKENVSGVRIYLDDQFHVMMRSRIFDANEALSKSLTILDFKKADGVWIFGAFDARNEKTRNKARFKIVDASMRLDLDDRYFRPEGLGESIVDKDLLSGAKPVSN